MPTATHMLELEEAAPSEVSLESCYAAHHATIFRLGLRYGGGSSAWAEDLVHDVFLKLAETAHELHRHEDLGGWLYRVASNLAISRLRRERSFVGRVVHLLTGDQSDVEPATDVVFERHELASRAMQALRELPPKEQVVLSMKILDDKSQKDIAEALSMSEGYVSKLVTRALARIESQGWEVTSC